MEENVKSNAEESGTGLVDQVQNNADNQEFDINKWNEQQGSLTNKENNSDNNGTDNSDDNSQSNDSDNTGDDDELPVWTIDDEEENSNAEENLNTDDNPDASATNTAAETSQDYDYGTLSNELGFEVKSKEDLIQKYRELQEQIEEAKIIKVGNLTNKKIETWQSYVSLQDEDLVKADLKAQGFDDNEIEETLDTYKDNRLLSIEAKKIRKTLNAHISKEQHAIIQQKETEAQRQKADVEESRKKIKTTLENTETMFGYKIAKSADEMKKVREGHYKYVTEKFINDITSNEQNVIEAAWLWRNRETILNAVKSSGAQLGKKEILDTLQNPDNGKTNRIMAPKDGGFDPKKFAYGANQ
jgi:hypothetical protein